MKKLYPETVVHCARHYLYRRGFYADYSFLFTTRLFQEHLTLYITGLITRESLAGISHELLHESTKRFVPIPSALFSVLSYVSKPPRNRKQTDAWDRKLVDFAKIVPCPDG